MVLAKVSISLVFFFQAEDGIRDKLVTGVQTCALPICGRIGMRIGARPADRSGSNVTTAGRARIPVAVPAGQPPNACVRLLYRSGERSSWRSEERRVGKECRCRWAA